MSYSVKISEQANSDLREIFEYISFGLQSFQNAEGQLSRLEKKIVNIIRILYGGRDIDTELAKHTEE